MLVVYMYLELKVISSRDYEKANVVKMYCSVFQKNSEELSHSLQTVT